MIIRVLQILLLLILPFILNKTSILNFPPSSEILFTKSIVYLGVLITFVDYLKQRGKYIHSFKDTLIDPYIIFALLLFLWGLKRYLLKYFGFELYDTNTGIFIGNSFIWAVLLFISVVFIEAIYQFFKNDSKQILFCNKRNLTVSWLMLGCYWQWSLKEYVIVTAVLIFIIDCLSNKKAAT